MAAVTRCGQRRSEQQVCSTIRQTVTNYTDNSIFFAWNAVLEARTASRIPTISLFTLRDDTVALTW